MGRDAAIQSVTREAIARVRSRFWTAPRPISSSCVPASKAQVQSSVVRLPLLAELGDRTAADQLVRRAGPALGLGQPRGQGQYHLPVTGRGTGQTDALGGKIVLRGQVAGGEELLEGAMGEGELPLAVLLALADQEASALLDVLHHHSGLVPAVVQQGPEGLQHLALADVGGAVLADVLGVHPEGQLLQHLAQVRELQGRNGQLLQQRLVGADLPIPAQHEQVNGVVVEVGPVVRQPAAVRVQRGHQGQQQGIPGQGCQIRAPARVEQVGHLAFALAGRRASRE